MSSALDRYAAAEALRRSGQYRKAIAAYDEAIRLDEHCRPAVSRRAKTLVEIGKEPGHRDELLRAVDGYIAALHLPPPAFLPVIPDDDYDPTYDRYNLGVAYGLLREFELALDAYDTSLAGTPCDGLALFNRANLLWRMGRPADAEKSFRDAIGCNDAFAEARNNLGALLVVLRRPREAVTLLVASIARLRSLQWVVGPVQPWQLFDTLATAQLALNLDGSPADPDVRDALATLDRAVTTIPIPPPLPGDAPAAADAFALIYLRRGYCQARLGELAGARDSMAAATRWAPASSLAGLVAARNLRRMPTPGFSSWTVPVGPAGVLAAVLALIFLVFVAVEVARGRVSGDALASVAGVTFGVILIGVSLPRLTSFKVGAAEASFAEEVVTKTSFELVDLGAPD